MVRDSGVQSSTALTRWGWPCMEREAAAPQLPELPMPNRRQCGSALQPQVRSGRCVWQLAAGHDGSTPLVGGSAGLPAAPESGPPSSWARRKQSAPAEAGGARGGDQIWMDASTGPSEWSACVGEGGMQAHLEPVDEALHLLALWHLKLPLLQRLGPAGSSGIHG